MRFALITAAALTASVLVGCKEEAKVTPTTRTSDPVTAADTQPTVVDKTKGTLGAIGDEMGKAGEKIGDKAGELKDKTADKTADLKDKAADKSAEMKANAEAKTDQSVAAKVSEQAQKYYDQAMEAVKKKDFSAADSALENLEKIKPQLSTDWQSKVDTLKSTIETAKKAGAVKIPGVTE